MKKILITMLVLSTVLVAFDFKTLNKSFNQTGSKIDTTKSFTVGESQNITLRYFYEGTDSVNVIANIEGQVGNGWVVLVRDTNLVTATVTTKTKNITLRTSSTDNLTGINNIRVLLRQTIGDGADSTGTWYLNLLER